jgi:protein-S-isoprenylcysteine O-methyltransferase Ste14
MREMIKSHISREEEKELLRTMLVRIPLFPLVLGLLVLLPAGTWDYWEFYVLMGVMLIPLLGVIAYFIRMDPAFLIRRMRSREKEQEQKLIQGLSSLVYLAGFVIPALDKRFAWTEVPVWMVIAADVLIFLGYLMVFKVFRQNSYASRIVQVEDDQKLITDGLYGRVRHPMYSAVLIMFLPMGLALGSYWGLLPMAAIPFFLVLRIRNEEKVLREGLEGYDAYCENVRYRLIPLIW